MLFVVKGQRYKSYRVAKKHSCKVLEGDLQVMEGISKRHTEGTEAHGENKEDLN